MISQAYLDRLEMIESGGNPLAKNKNSTAKGAYQFIDSTAKQYGLKDPYNREESRKAAEALSRDNYNVLKKKLGRAPTEGELYLAHQQGAGGAAKLLMNPNVKAKDLVGPDAVKNNRGKDDMTAQEFADLWTSKFGDVSGGEGESLIGDPGEDDLSGLTPEEEEELAALEAEFGESISALTPEEEAELAELEAEFGAEPKKDPDQAAREARTDKLYSGPLGGFNKKTDALKAGILDTATFGLKDEAVAGIMSAPALFTGEKYTDAFDRNLKDIQYAENIAIKENPLTYGAGALTTGIRGAGGVLGKGVDNLTRTGLLPKATGLIGKTANAATKMAVGYASAYPLGRVYGYGMADAGEDRTAASKSAGTVSGVLGALFPVAGPLAGKLIDKTGRGVLNKVAGNIDKKAAIKAGQDFSDNIPYKKVVDRLRKDYPIEADFKRALQSYSDETGVSLAELGGKNTTTLARGAAQFPTGEVKTEQFLDRKIGSASGRIKDSVSKYISPDRDFYGTLDDVIEKGRAKAKPLYDQAYKANKTVVSREIDNILETPAGRKALKEAATMMQNDRSLMGLPDAELKAIQRDLASVGKMDELSGPIAGGLNLRTLDAVKRSLDDQIGVLMRSGEGNKAKGIIDLKNNLLKALDEADITGRAGPNSLKAEGGAYARARAVSGDYITTSKAMESGRDFMRLDPDQIKKQFSKFAPSEKEAYKAGIVRRIRDEIDKSTDNANLYKRVFGKEEVRNRIKSVLGEDDFMQLTKTMRAEERLYKFRDKVIGGSPTTPKLKAAAEFDSVGQEYLEAAAENGFASVGRKAILNTIKGRFSGLSDTTAGKVADILYETDPAKKLEILKKLETAAGINKSEGQLAVQAAFDVMDKVKALRLAKPPAPVLGSTITQ
jgi:hypothetical protein